LDFNLERIVNPENLVENTFDSLTKRIDLERIHMALILFKQLEAQKYIQYKRVRQSKDKKFVTIRMRLCLNRPFPSVTDNDFREELFTGYEGYFHGMVDNGVGGQQRVDLRIVDRLF
jgi:hypothetical protein